MCTGIGFVTKDGQVTFGRTQEYALPLPVQAAIIPRKFVSKSQLLSPITFKYATLAVVMDGKMADMNLRDKMSKEMPDLKNILSETSETELIMDGVNEKGLAGGSFYFGNGYNKYAELEVIQKLNKTPLRGEEVVTYVLANYSSVQDIKEHINQDVQVANVKNLLGDAQPQHYVFYDQSGASISVEPDHYDGFTITDNKVKVFTNTPHFDWHLKNLQNYTGLSCYATPTRNIGEQEVFSGGLGSGLTGLPGDFTPQSRFVRAAILRDLMVVPENVEEALHHTYNLLNQFDIPYGAIRKTSPFNPEEETIQYTQYTSAYGLNPEKLILTIKTFEDNQISRLEMTPDLFEGEKVLRAAVSRKESYHFLKIGV